MNSEEIESGTLKETKIQITSTDDDKKFVSQAVAFVIGHTRNGSMVPLCASIATLLKDQRKLKLENEYLKQHISELKYKLLEQSSVNVVPVYGIPERRKKLNSIQNYKFSRKNFQSKSFKPLRDCLCDACASDISSSFLSAPLNKGDEVVISGELSGTVCYVGHVERLSTTEIYVGLHLVEAGDCDGRCGVKTYFETPPNCGLFTPLWNVRCLIK